MALQLALIVEINVDSAHLARCRDQAVDLVRIDRLRLLPGQTEQNGGVSPVPLPGPREGAEQRDVIAGCTWRRLKERSRRLHRPDRVRTRRADTDLEDVEYADRRHQSEPSVSRLALPPTAEMLLLSVNSVPKRCT